MMKDMGYELARGEGLCFGKGRRTPFLPFAPKGKSTDYYHKSRRGLGYVSSSPPQCHESYKEVEDDSSTDTSPDSSLWESDVSTGAMYKSLMANMATANPL